MSNNIQIIRGQIEAMDAQFAAGLPAHIPVERFMRVVMTAIQGNGSLLKCDRQSLFAACVKAAQDGLLPDGREGALVAFKGQVQWMPMIAGIRKKVRNSGEMATWDVHAVYEKDQFEFELGDEPFIRHKPNLKDRGELIAVYSIATLKSGEKSRDVMGIEAVKKIQKLSPSKNGPWSNPTFFDEMAKKTVARRHSKVLPMSTDLDDLIRRDDVLYDLESSSDAVVKPASAGLKSRMEEATALEAPKDEIAHDEETGEVQEETVPEPDKTEEKPDKKQEPADTKPASDDAGSGQSSDDEAYQKGKKSCDDGLSRRAVPAEYKKEGLEAQKEAWLQGFDDAVKEAENA